MKSWVRDFGRFHSGGEDISGLRYERLQLGSAFGYRELILIYEPQAAFTEWDEEYLLRSAKNLIESARARRLNPVVIDANWPGYDC